MAVHPKRPSEEELIRYQNSVDWADLIDYAYWKTAVMLLERFPNDKPKILQHHNPYNVNEQKWEEFDKVVVNNSTIHEQLKEAELIRNTINLDLFKFQREYPNSKKVLMVAARAEGKKGILPVAEVCQELGLDMILVGSVSDARYIQKVLSLRKEVRGGEQGEPVVDFRENITDEALVEAYKEAAVVVINSVDNYESGPLIALEAMSVGVPVITRNVGLIPDIYNGENMIVRQGQPEDKTELKNILKNLMDNIDKRMDLRDKGWQTAKTMNDTRRAWRYEDLYYRVLYKSKPLVSVIIPTFNRKEYLVKIIKGIELQDWPVIEIIICDDGSSDGTKEMIEQMKPELKRVIKHVGTGTPDTYNLALARNLGIIESSADILVFLDDRYYPDKKMVSNFLKKMKSKTWLYGNKGIKKDFVENVSCIYKEDIVKMGMFNTSVPLYGFQSQELRQRFGNAKFKFEFVENAKVETLFNTKNKYTKKDEIIASKNILHKLNLDV